VFLSLSTTSRLGEDDADNPTLSSIDSDDSPPTVRDKKRQRKKKNKARKSQEKAIAKHGDSSSDNDSDVPIVAQDQLSLVIVY
jgi:hypothetical protein